MQEFLRGRAVVDPQTNACQRCHLQVLCRVQTALVPMPSEPLQDSPA
jgi:hypothetical protein